MREDRCAMSQFSILCHSKLESSDLQKNYKILQTTRPLVPREVTDCLHNGQLRRCGLGEKSVSFQQV